MHFNITMDNGQEILGYLTPDGFSQDSVVKVQHSGSTWHVKSEIYYPPAKILGHHETGICGFSLNENNIPGISFASDLSVSDAETGFTFYRRFNGQLHINKKVFRLETHFIPNTQLDRSLEPHFQFYVSQAENFGVDTAKEMLQIQNQPSWYISGRLLFRSIQDLIPTDGLSVATMYDPFYEFALRIATLSLLQTKNLSYVSRRERMLFAPAIDYFQKLNLTDENAIEERIRLAPQDVLELLESPVLKQLTVTTPNERPKRDSIGTALDMLSRFDFFNIDPEGTDFSADIAQLLGISELKVRSTSKLPQLLELSQKLQKITRLERLLEGDLMLFHFVKQAQIKAHSQTA